MKKGYEDERRALERLRARKAELLKEIDELKAGLSTVSVELDALKSVKAKEEREAVARTEAYDSILLLILSDRAFLASIITAPLPS